MVLAVNPVIELVNVPVVEPSVVLVAKAIVGLEEVLQQTPLTVTVAPPLPVIFPPLVAVVWVIDVAIEVVIVGIVFAALVVKVNSFP